MASERKYSIRFIKNFPIRTPTDEWFDIYGKDINISRCPDLVCASNLTEVKLLGYLQELKEKNRRLLDLQMTSEGVWDSDGLEIYLYKEILEQLCKICPKPFLQIQCKYDYQDKGLNRQKFKTSLDLSEILEASKTEQWQVVKKLCMSGSEGCMNILCDILIGWKEPVGNATATVPKTKPTKINTASFSQNLFEKESSKDLTIIAGNKVELKCHKIIFEAHSEVLATMVSPDHGMKEFQTGRVEMPENSEGGLSHLIRYLYCMELSIDDFTSDVAVELLKTAHKYKLIELEEYLSEMLLQKGTEWFTGDALLELYFHVKNLDGFRPLHDYLLAIMTSLSQEIRACERFKELQRTDPEAACGLVWKLFDLTI